MGQAKNRGSFEDRKNKSKRMNFDDMTIEEIKVYFDCHESAVFKGYVIHSETRNDFLAEETEDDLVVERYYCKDPTDALKITSYNNAKKLAKKLLTISRVGVLFENSENLQVWFLENSN